jgi:hypothetical protein
MGISALANNAHHHSGWNKMEPSLMNPNRHLVPSQTSYQDQTVIHRKNQSPTEYLKLHSVLNKWQILIYSLFKNKLFSGFFPRNKILWLTLFYPISYNCYV